MTAKPFCIEEQLRMVPPDYTFYSGDQQRSMPVGRWCRQAIAVIGQLRNQIERDTIVHEIEVQKFNERINALTLQLHHKE